jgi:heat shock protein HslJ
MARLLLLLALVLTALLPASASAASLAHHTWRATRIGGENVRSSHQWLRFSGHNDFSGRATGCGGGFSGHYRSTGTQLRFEDVRVQGVGCDGSGPPPPPSLGAVTAKTRFYRITGRKLVLLGRRGHRLAVLRRL